GRSHHHGHAEIDRADGVLEIVGDHPGDFQAQRFFHFFWRDVPALLHIAIDHDLDFLLVDAHAAQRAQESLGVAGARDVELHDDDVHIRALHEAGIERIDAHQRIDHDIVVHALKHAE